MAIDKTALAAFLAKRGYEINCSMDEHIETWKSWYKGNVKGFHDYRVWNGQRQLDCKRASLQLGKSIPEQIGNLLFNEKCSIAIDDGTTKESKEAGVSGTNQTDAFVKHVFDQNDIYVKLNECQEKKSAFGTVAYIPYYTSSGIRMNYITADHMIPLSWENGSINELCVFSPSVIDGEEYVFSQLFTREHNTGEYVIENLLLKGSSDRKVFASSYSEVEDFSEIRGYESIEKIVKTKSTIKPFVIDKLNIVNNIDPDNPLGLAIFANAIDAMRACDVIFDSYQNEFLLGKKRIMVATEATNIRNGMPVFDPNELTYHMLPEGVSNSDQPFIKEMDMKIRAGEHEQSLRSALNMCSQQCGLGENYFRYEQGGAATATQVISENNTLFRTMKKHEIILEACLVDLVRLIIDIGIRHNLSAGLNLDAEITIKFDDSVIEDKDKEIQRRMAMVAARLYKPLAYVSWYFGVTEDEAKKLMPDLPDDNGEEGRQ